VIPLPGWTSGVWVLLAPVLVIVVAASVILLLDLVLRGRRFPWALLSVAGLALAAVAVLGQRGSADPGAEAFLSGALRIDGFGVFMQVLLLVAAALALAAADGYLEAAGRRQPAEFHALALFAVSGMLLLVTAGDLVTLFLGLELLSFPTYVLCAFRRDDVKSNEAALKYFVLGSFASSVFLYGVALVWGATGTTSLRALAGMPGGALFHLGALFVLAGFLFKVGAAPFHMWVPDVYEGAPTPVTAFMATAVKVAAFGALMRIVIGVLAEAALPLGNILWWVACLTMVVGNLSALTQDNVKRMLAFSSVAHAGYMLVGLTAAAVSGWPAGGAAVLYYLLAYTFMNVGAFTVVMLLGRRAEGDLNFERDWSGAARHHPVLGFAMVVFMLGLGGVPPTAGFFGKYSVFKAAVDAGLTSLVVIAVLNSVVSVYYYLRVVVALYMRPERAALSGLLAGLGDHAAGGHDAVGPGAMAAAEAAAVPPRYAELGAWPAKLVVGLCVLGTLWFGLGPSLGQLPGMARVMEWAVTAVASLR
jgi:NADH-quinone oxidoreductase subunit N